MTSLIDAAWLPSHRADPVAAALYRRHYSAGKNRVAVRHQQNIVGPGRPMVLVTADCSAVFAWLRTRTERLDRQQGVCCTLFRNEGSLLSSDLIREACDLAWQRWPGERLFTYVDPSAVRSSNPGACFKHAGWRLVRTASGTPHTSRRGLLLLEHRPEVTDAV
jgi:hypothetical protein